MISEIRLKLANLANVTKAKTWCRFFKMQKGEYAEHDIFIGVMVPDLQKIAKQFYKTISAEDILLLLKSEIHEERALALRILVEQYKKTKDEKIVNFYILNASLVNNWDLVDCSSYKILGNYILDNPSKISILYDFAKHNNLWVNRISIVSTFALIKREQYEHTFKIIEILSKHKHHIIKKAIKWMLSEIHKRQSKDIN